MCKFHHLFWTLLLVPNGTALAQGPVITSFAPVANARSATRTGTITVNFSQPLAPASAGALKVYSSQRGGLRSRGGRGATVSGNALNFAPIAYPFMPGELVQYTVTTAAKSGSGALAQARVGQFTTAVNDSSRGVFGLGSNITLLPSLISDVAIAMADVDGDGDLDLVTSSQLCLNDGNGGFVLDQPMAPRIYDVKAGDIDGDGDLDLLTANRIDNTVSVLLNNGTGVFINSQKVSVGAGPSHLAVADVDGDGDLDLLTSNIGINNPPYAPSVNTVSIRLNGGNSSGVPGLFGNGSDLKLGVYPINLVTGDVDNDGDLDLVVTDSNTLFATVCINNASGIFKIGQSVPVGFSAQAATLADVNGDGHLDLLTVNTGSLPGTVSLRLNNGTGTFGAGQDIVVGNTATDLAVGDIDGDGDLDVLTANRRFRSVSVRLNDGSGRYSGKLDMYGFAFGLSKIALADVDGDGDIDLIASSDEEASIHFNLGGVVTPPARLVATFAVYPNPVRSTVSVLGGSPNTPLVLFDDLGRIKFTSRTDEFGEAHLALPPTLPGGLYLLRNGNMVQRIIVE